MKPLSLYIHIPFCVQKCDYCDFLSFSATDGEKAAYVNALIDELNAASVTLGAAAGEREVISVYIGGGTPSAIPAEDIVRILGAVREGFFMDPDCEISMEVNPGTVTVENLNVYRAAGINRLSVGCQSMHDNELKLLGRIHTKQDILNTFHAARRAGFTNINIDLMSALPDQKYDDYMDSVAQVVALSPEHISAYALMLEEGTPFYEEYSDEIRDEDLDLQMYMETNRYLSAHGYERYEISNYARLSDDAGERTNNDAYRCLHNVVYWKRGDYLGCGLGASSLIDEVRFHNTEDFDAYIASAGNPDTLHEDIEELDYHARMEEFMFLGLRMTEGISVKNFEETFHHPIRRIYAKAIDSLKEEGLLAVEGDTIRLTDTGINVSNYALARFLFDE